MTYFRNRLAEHEAVVFQGRFHWFSHALAWAALIILGVVIVGVFLFVGMMVRIATTEFAVTSRRVLLKRGLFNIDVDSLSLEAIETVKLHESFIGQLLGFGVVTVHGRGDQCLEFPPMARPDAFMAALEEARIARDGLD